MAASESSRTEFIPFNERSSVSIRRQQSRTEFIPFIEKHSGWQSFSTLDKRNEFRSTLLTPNWHQRPFVKRNEFRSTTLIP